MSMYINRGKYFIRCNSNWKIISILGNYGGKNIIGSFLVSDLYLNAKS